MAHGLEAITLSTGTVMQSYRIERKGLGTEVIFCSDGSISVYLHGSISRPLWNNGYHDGVRGLPHGTSLKRTLKAHAAKGPEVLGEVERLYTNGYKAGAERTIEYAKHDAKRGY